MQPGVDDNNRCQALKGRDVVCSLEYRLYAARSSAGRMCNETALWPALVKNLSRISGEPACRFGVSILGNLTDILLLINAQNFPDCLNILLIQNVFPFRGVHIVYSVHMAVDNFRPDQFPKAVEQLVISAEGFINNCYC